MKTYVYKYKKNKNIQVVISAYDDKKAEEMLRDVVLKDSDFILDTRYSEV